MTRPDGYCARCGETPCLLIGPSGDYIGWSEMVAIARLHDVACRLRNLATCIREAAALCEAFRLGRVHGAWCEDPWPDDEPWKSGCNIPRPRPNEEGEK